MGAAFAGVFCGVLVGCLLDLGTSMMAVVVESLCGRVSEKGVVGQKRDLRSGDGVHLLIADRLRHLGKVLWFRDARWQNVEGCCVLVSASAVLSGTERGDLALNFGWLRLAADRAWKNDRRSWTRVDDALVHDSALGEVKATCLLFVAWTLQVFEAFSAVP